MRSLMLGCVHFLVLTTLAQAQSVAGAVENFQLLGVWAVDCSRLPAPRNEHATFSKTTSGDIQVVNDFGWDYDHMVYRIVNAERVGSERLALRQVLTTDRSIVVDVVVWKVNDRIRIWSSRVSNGNTLVVDGVVTSTNGHETPWEGRCNERSAVRSHPQLINGK
jgi:hypothetical protein